MRAGILTESDLAAHLRSTQAEELPLHLEVTQLEEHDREPPLGEGTDQELGEESDLEDDSLVDPPHAEPEAETEPIGLRGRDQSTRDAPEGSTVVQPGEDPLEDNSSLSNCRGASGAPDYNPFDRPEGEVVTQAFDDSPSEAPHKRRRQN